MCLFFSWPFLVSCDNVEVMKRTLNHLDRRCCADVVNYTFFMSFFSSSVFDTKHLRIQNHPGQCSLKTLICQIKNKTCFSYLQFFPTQHHICCWNWKAYYIFKSCEALQMHLITSTKGSNIVINDIGKMNPQSLGSNLLYLFMTSDAQFMIIGLCLCDSLSCLCNLHQRWNLSMLSHRFPKLYLLNYL